MKVFISYAREDWEIAEKVWSDLKRAGIDAWIDRKELLPGQNWKTEISKAIKASSHFIALLSTRSVSKQGFFQTELKKAIDVLDIFPEHRIYFIPARIDNCKLGYERIGDIQWAYLFPSYEDGLCQILRGIAPENSEKLKSQAQKPKYQLRKEPMTVSTEEAQTKFKLNEKWRPVEYIKSDFKDNENGTITDYSTGLMWQQLGSDHYMSYEKAKEYIDELNRNKFAGYSAWRLPTVDELKSLLTLERQSNDLYINPIFEKFEKKDNWFWTSDICASGAWLVIFVSGGVGWLNLYFTYYVRAVRSINDLNQD